MLERSTETLPGLLLPKSVSSTTTPTIHRINTVIFSDTPNVFTARVCARVTRARCMIHTRYIFTTANFLSFLQIDWGGGIE